MAEPSQGGSGGSWFVPRRSAEPGSSVLGDARQNPPEAPAPAWDSAQTPNGFTAETQEFPPPPPGFTPEPQTFGEDALGFGAEPQRFTADTQQGSAAATQGFATDGQGFATDARGFTINDQGFTADTQRLSADAQSAASGQSGTSGTSGTDAQETGTAPEPGPPTAGFGYWDSEEQLPPPPPDEPPTIHREGAAQQSTAGMSAASPDGAAPKPETLTRRPQGARRYRNLRNEGLWNPHRSAPPKASNAPPRSERSNTNFVLLIVASTVAALLVAGGVDMAQGGGDEGGGANAEQGARPEADAPAGERPDGGKGGGKGGKGGNGGNAADRKAFAGTWQSKRGEELTISAKARGEARSGKQSVSYDRTGKLSTCPGVGQVRASGKAFRLALQCDNGDVRSELGGDAVRAGGKLTVEWDGGTRDTFTREKSDAKGE